MAKKKKTTDAVALLHYRFVKGDPEREACIQAEREKANIADLSSPKGEGFRPRSRHLKGGILFAQVDTICWAFLVSSLVRA